MADTAYEGVTVGLEVHQQLDTGRKLFCGCAPAETEEYPLSFRRRLRASSGETGEYDAAALFEQSRSKETTYRANPASSCPVEYDEEPPHALDPGAREAALIIASALGSAVYGEIYPMRKTVVDGSNTTGFQRTMLVSAGGSFEAGGRTVGIQSVCLEEDAAKLLEGQDGGRSYGLGRLGTPLIEIATAPFAARPGHAREAALALGRMLRSTRRVRRGLGTIRQDVNVSVEGGGAVVEVKGVQQLDQLERVVVYEAQRQRGMMEISGMLRKRGWDGRTAATADVTGLLSGSGSKVVSSAVKKGHTVTAASFAGLAGMFGHSPSPDVRLGRDVAELVRSFGVGGVFHSDELPGYGLEQSDVDSVRGTLGAGEEDAFLVLAAPADMAGTIMEQAVRRMRQVMDCGIPADTRMAVQDGTTRFLRPRPGAARMYPETDVPPLVISPAELEEARGSVPVPWDEAVRGLGERHGINPQLAEQVFDSRYAPLFESIVAGCDVSPTFVASSLCSTITNLEREGHDAGRLADGEISEAFSLLAAGSIPKESIGMIFESIMSGQAGTVKEAVAGSSIGGVDESELAGIIGRIIGENAGIIESQGERAMGPLMGIAMKELRGKASGEAVSRLLAEGIRRRRS